MVKLAYLQVAECIQRGVCACARAPFLIRCLIHARALAQTNTGKTVKTNKLVIGIMVIQLISVSSVRLIEGNEQCENVCSITHAEQHEASESRSAME